MMSTRRNDQHHISTAALHIIHTVGAAAFAEPPYKELAVWVAQENGTDAPEEEDEEREAGIVDNIKPSLPMLGH